jgi:HSP20 family protein
MKELEEMQQQTGRMLRNMSLARMISLESNQWQPAIDVYESDRKFIVYCDLAGVDNNSFSVAVDESHVRISGKRKLPEHETIACVHQLEIELGQFNRSISLPGRVDVDAVRSVYTNGILTIYLPKKQARGRVNIIITSGEE